VHLSDEDFAIIDAAATPNRAAFMVAAAREAAMRIRRARQDAEIEAIMRENADHDAFLASEFDSAPEDGR
jgi:hypothetical protein